MSKLNDLPESKDEFWSGEEKHHSRPVAIPICSTHSMSKWKEHIGYKQENGVVLCTVCPWGTPLPGHLRVIDERIVDLRGL